MPMSPRLLRPRQGGDPDALRYIAAVQAADGQPLESGVRKAINDFVVGCKADGIWSAIKASCILAGARTLAGALTPLAGTAPTNFNFVSGDYNRKTGLVGNGSTKYLNSNRSADSDPQNNCHAAVYGSTLTAGVASPSFNAKLWAGSANAGGTTKNLGLFWLNLGPGFTGYFLNLRRDGGNAIFNSSLTSSGFVGVSRAASASYTARFGGGNNTANVTSQSPTADKTHVFAGNTGGTAGDFSDSRLAFYSFGESLTLAAYDSRLTKLFADLSAAIP